MNSYTWDSPTIPPLRFDDLIAAGIPDAVPESPEAEAAAMSVEQRSSWQRPPLQHDVQDAPAEQPQQQTALQPDASPQQQLHPRPQEGSALVSEDGCLAAQPQQQQQQQPSQPASQPFPAADPRRASRVSTVASCTSSGGNWRRGGVRPIPSAAGRPLRCWTCHIVPVLCKRLRTAVSGLYGRS